MQEKIYIYTYSLSWLERIFAQYKTNYSIVLKYGEKSKSYRYYAKTKFNVRKWRDKAVP